MRPSSPSLLTDAFCSLREKNDNRTYHLGYTANVLLVINLGKEVWLAAVSAPSHGKVQLGMTGPFPVRYHSPEV